MKHMKKILSFALVLVMVLSCMPIQALAAENEETAYVAINKTTGKGYESLAVAMAECRKGETVALQKDASEGQILVPANGTLDLNGCTLEAEYMSCFGSLIDSSDDNSGLLKTNEDYFMIREDNKQLPIKDGTGYRFVEITKINTKMLSPTKFVFQPLFEAAALDLIAKGGDVTGLTVQVLVSWKQDEGYRTQQFVYDDNLLTQFLDSYNATTGKYGKMFTLTLNNVDGIEELSFAAVLASSTKVTISSNDPVEEDEEIFSASTNLSKDDLIYGTLANEVTLSGTTGVSAVVPAAVKVETGAAALALSVKKAETGSEITLGAGESAQSLDVHIAGVAADNKVPMIVNLGAILEKGLSDTELKLYHTENGVAVLMTRVASAADFAIHNQYTYNPETGEVSIYVASFSVFSAVNTTVDVWDGEAVADGFASGTGTEEDPFIIETAAQLVYFRNQVDSGITFEDQFIKLGTDIDLNKILFNPIGRGYVNNGGQAFMGTFDGANHTVYNLYQNGWELGDSYNTAGAGLFASIQNATIKNLAVCGANIVFECVDMGIVVGYAQGTCHFENIVVTNSTIANYNRSTGGVVGEVCYGPYGTDVENGYSHTFKNITVDSSVKISSLWGSFDTLCGGVIGGKWGDATVKMENITVACELDVFSDVTAAYRWYAYRRCGMLIGYTEQESPKKALNAAADFLTCENVEVYYGDWVNYTYYEFADQDSDTGKRYPWVRAEAGEHNEAFSNPRYGVPTYDGVKVTDGSKATASANITFDQLYGGGQGVYGAADHTGVATYNDKTSKTVYIYNDKGWENLKLQYWYQNGEDTWSTVVKGVDMQSMFLGNNVYQIDLPIKANGFQIIADGDNKGAEILLSEVTEGGIYTLDGEVHNHVYEDGKCACGVEQQKKWQLVTDASQLQTGDKIVIVATNADNGLSTTQKDKNRGVAAVVKNDNIVTFGNDVQIITLTQGLNSGEFGFYVEGTDTGYLYAASSTANQLKTKNDLDVHGSWTIDINAGIASIVAKSSSNRNVMQYNPNNGSPLFACYESAKFTAVEIYKLVAGCEHLYIQSGVTAPTCTEAGEITYTCSKCDVTTSEKIEATGHNYNSEVTEPTCTEDGSTKYTCANCGDTYSEVIKATGHDFANETITTPAGCETEGEKTGTCTACGETTSEKIDALGHTWGEWAETTPATCTATGVDTRECSACDATETRETAKKAHSYNTVVTAPTCVDAGYTTYTCSVCSDTYTGDAVAATGEHTYVDGACSVCGATESTSTETNRYYIATKRSSGNYFYMTSNLGTAGTKRYQAVDSGLTILPASITAPEDDYVFVLIENDDGTYYLRAEGVEGNNYLGWTSGNSGALVAEGSAQKLTMTQNDNGTVCFFFDTRYLSLNSTSGNNYFAWYTGTQTQNLILIPVVGGDETPCTHTNTTTTTVDATCTEAGSTTVTCDDCGETVSTETIDALGHTTDNGVCERCDETIGGTTPSEPTTVTMNIYGSTGTTGTDTISWTSDDVTFTNNKAGSSTDIRTTDTDHYRVYGKSTVTISAAGNITKIVITCTSSSYANALQTSLTNGGYTATVSGSAVTVEITAEVNEITFTASAQIRLKSIVVTYEA